MTETPLPRRARMGPTVAQAMSLCLALLLTPAGCATSPSPIARPDPRPLGATLPAYSATEATPKTALAEPEALAPQGDLTLRDALAAALLRNPDLAAFSWEIRVREARALQAGLLPNPDLAFEVENIAGSGAFDGTDQSETTLALGQLIELGGKRVKRRRVAELDAALAGWDYEVKRVEVLAGVARTFADVLVAQEQRELTHELMRLATASRTSVRKQVRAGAASSVELTRAEVTVASQAIEQTRAETALSTARLRLAALWGSREATFGRVRGDLRRVRPPPALDTVVTRLDQSPEIARWVEETALREAVADLEEAKRLPDVTASPGLRRFEESDDSALVFGLSVPFPIYDRNQGARLAAQSQLSKSRHLERAARVRVETSLRSTLSDLRSSHTEVLALRENAVPQAEAALNGVRDGYLRGLFRYVDVLDAQRTLFELRTQELDALQRYHTAVTEIERLTGSPFDGASPASPTIPDTKGVRP